MTIEITPITAEDIICGEGFYTESGRFSRNYNEEPTTLGPYTFLHFWDAAGVSQVFRADRAARLATKWAIRRTAAKLADAY